MANIAIISKEREFIIPPFDITLAGTTAKEIMLEWKNGLISKSIITNIRQGMIKTKEAKKIAKEVLILGGGAVVPVLKWDDVVICDSPGDVCIELQRHLHNI